jgi:hypothetical protein
VFFNPAFDYVLQTISRDNEVSREDVERRDPPDLLVEITVDDPLGYKLPTNLDYKFSAGFVGRASAKVVDRAGNIVFGASSIDLVEDQVTQGIDFSPEDRAEISIKNVLISLAEKIAKEYKPTTLSFAVTPKGDSYVTADPGRLLRSKTEFPVFRKVKLAGSSTTVSFPVGFLKSTRLSGSERELLKVPKLVGPQKIEISSGDAIIIKNSVSKALSGESALALCGPAQNRGTIELPNMNKKVFLALSRSMSYPFVDDGAFTAVDFMFRGESGFVETKKEAAKDGQSGEFCIQPIQKIVSQPKVCKKSICQIPLSVTLGASLLRSGSSLIVKGVAQDVMTQGFGESATDEEQAKLLASTAEQTVDSALVALTELVKPAFETVLQQQSGNSN